MSSISVRYFLVTGEDEIIRLSCARFDRLDSNPPNVDGYENTHLSGGQPELNKIPPGHKPESPALI